MFLVGSLSSIHFRNEETLFDSSRQHTTWHSHSLCVLCHKRVQQGHCGRMGEASGHTPSSIPSNRWLHKYIYIYISATNATESSSSTCPQIFLWMRGFIWLISRASSAQGCYKSSRLSNGSTNHRREIIIFITSQPQCLWLNKSRKTLHVSFSFIPLKFCDK